MCPTSQLHLFTLNLMQLTCIGSLYRTYVYRDGCTGAPSGILSLEGKECPVLLISVHLHGRLAQGPLSQGKKGCHKTLSLESGVSG